MSCMLRISGKNFDVNNFTNITRLKPSSVFLKGEPRFKTKPEGKKISESGVNIVVSKTNFSNLDKQIGDAVKFLKKYNNKLNSYINSKSDIDNFVLDFGIKRRNVAVQCDNFPSELLGLAGNLGISIQLSQYPIN